MPECIQLWTARPNGSGADGYHLAGNIFRAMQDPLIAFLIKYILVSCRDLGYAFTSPYPIGEPPRLTSKWLLAERGTSKKHVPLKFVSNNAPTEEEWDDLVKVDRDSGQRALLRLDIKDGAMQLHEAKT